MRTRGSDCKNLSPSLWGGYCLRGELEHIRLESLTAQELVAKLHALGVVRPHLCCRKASAGGWIQSSDQRGMEDVEST